METEQWVDRERAIWKVLPLHPHPQPLESFTSYLIRLTEANGFKSIYDIAVLVGVKHRWNWIYHSADFPNATYTGLAQVVGCRPTQVMMTTFLPIAQNFGYPSHPQPLHRFLQDSLASMLRYCPSCL